MNIAKVNNGLTNRIKIHQNNKTSSNPFESSNFRGNVLPFTDVFQSAKKMNTGLGLQNKIKMISGAVTGSVADFGKKIYEPVSNFAHRIKTGTVKTWEKILIFKDSVSEKVSSVFKNKNYVNPDTSVADLRNMFYVELESIGGLPL